MLIPPKLYINKKKHSFECFSFVNINTLLRSLLNWIHLFFFFSISYYNLCERKEIKYVLKFGIIERIFYIKLELL
jgi:hypothetical protein